MTLDEARALMNWADEEAPTVTVKRNGAEWTGQVVGVVDRPALVLRTDNGKLVIVLAGASVESPSSQLPKEDQ
jgi:hypothetical protein